MPSTPNSANGSHHHQQQHSKEVMPVQVGELMLAWLLLRFCANKANTNLLALRVRPLNSRDRAQPRFSQTAESDVIRTFENTITIVPHQKTYSFDHVFDTKSTQEQIFETVGSRLVDRFLDGKDNKSKRRIPQHTLYNSNAKITLLSIGFNVTILAYVSINKERV